MPSRAPSARLAAAKQRHATEDTAPKASKTKAPRATRTAKKQKTGKEQDAVSAPRQDDFRKIRGRRGQLKTMTELPFDVLLEIFGHLEPRDLLSISRATKELRAFLTSGNTAALWKQAYEALGSSTDPRSRPPPCPAGMNIMHYTNFLFGHNCQFCAAPKATIFHWTARVRVCNACAPKELKRRIYYGTLEGLTNKQVAFMLSVACYIRKPGTLGGGNYCLEKEIAAHVRALEKCPNDEAKTLYQETWRKKRREESQLSRDLQVWLSSQQYRKKDEMYTIRCQRREIITAKVKDEGYGPELNTNRYRIQFLPGGNVACKLTDKGWERIKPKILGVFEWQRQEKKKFEMIQIFHKRMSHLRTLVQQSGEGTPKPWIYAPAPYVARLEPFSTIMKDIRDDSDENLIKEKLNSLANLIPDISIAWRAEADKVLLGLLLRAKKATNLNKKQQLDRKPLDLASTFFACNCKCTDPISYPRILMHSCLWLKTIPDNDNDEAPKEGADNEEETDEKEGGDDDDIDGGNSDNANEVYGIPTVTADTVWNKMSSWASLPWNDSGDDIWIDEEASGYAKAIIRACGEDPDAVTSAVMNARKDIRVECTRCVPVDGAKTKGRTRRVMTWKTAILHDIEIHSEEPESVQTGWRPVTGSADLEQIHKLETTKPTNNRLPLMTDNRCCHCDQRIKVVDYHEFLKSHLSNMHNIQEPDEAKLRQHVYMPLDIPMKGYPFAVKI